MVRCQISSGFASINANQQQPPVIEVGALVFGRGDYAVQPIHVEDLARLAIEQGSHRDDVVVDAIGPESYTYRALMQAIGDAIGKRRLLVRVPAWLGLFCAKLLGVCLRDVLVTKEEIGALMDGLLATDSDPTGETRLSEWMREHAGDLGVHYAHELARRSDRDKSYRDLQVS